MYDGNEKERKKFNLSLLKWQARGERERMASLMKINGEGEEKVETESSTVKLNVQTHKKVSLITDNLKVNKRKYKTNSNWQQ